LLRKSRLPDAPVPSDHDVGVHYEDPRRSQGLARLYEAPTALGEFYRDRMTRIGALLDESEGDLLDVGCGTGQMLRFLRDTRPERFTLTGLDRSASMIAEASRVLDDEAGVRLVTGRIEEMPFTDSSFDTVLAMGVLEYVVSVRQAIAEIARVTRPGGRAIVTMQHPRSPYRLWEAAVWSRVRRSRGEIESPVVHRVGERQLHTLLKPAGLAPVFVVYYNFNLLLPPLDAHLPRLTVGLQRRLQNFGRGPLRGLGSDYILVARRAAAPVTPVGVARSASS
jgi:ubiquinone/menaquinone biosynthesis C-methylase UbiE